MKVIEIFGLPGSGKSNFYNNFYKKNKNLFIYEKKLLNEYKEKDLYIKFLSIIFFKYYKFLPSILLMSLILFLEKKLIKNSKYFKKNFEIIRNANKMIELSNFNINRKIRIKFFFLRNLILLNYYLNSKKDKNLFFDQFLIQLPYMRYDNFNKNKEKIEKMVYRYYNSLKKLKNFKSKLIYLDVPIRICKLRTDNRAYGRFYNTINDLNDFGALNKIRLVNLKKNDYEVINLNVNEKEKKLKIKNFLN